MCDQALSVVIPTYGEASYLGSVLQALVEQTYNSFDIVVVDNNESPRARQALELFTPRVTFLHCSERGLSAARNAGVAATHAEYIAFLDDDAVPEPTWAAELLSGLRRYECAASGGRVELALDGNLPGWYPPKLRCLLSELRHDGVDIPTITDGQYVVGANFCVQRRFLGRVGGFRLDFGRDGTCLRSNEELELCRRISKAGGRVAYLAAAAVRHHISAHRYTFKYLLQRSLWQGRSDAYLDLLHGRPAVFRRRSNLRNLLALIHRVGLLALSRNRPEAALGAANVFREYGYLSAYLKATLARKH